MENTKSKDLSAEDKKAFAKMIDRSETIFKNHDTYTIDSVKYSNKEGMFTVKTSAETKISYEDICIRYNTLMENIGRFEKEKNVNTLSRDMGVKEVLEIMKKEGIKCEGENIFEIYENLGEKGKVYFRDYMKGEVIMSGMRESVRIARQDLDILNKMLANNMLKPLTIAEIQERVKKKSKNNEKSKSK